MERHTVRQLRCGSASGYVGFNDKVRQLTEAVRRRPYTVVLSTKSKKAHPDVFQSCCCQLLRMVVWTGFKGRTVIFAKEHLDHHDLETIAFEG